MWLTLIALRNGIAILIAAGLYTFYRERRLIRGARGISGVNLDYLISTLRHLAELGIRERELERILTLIGPHAAGFAASERGSASAIGMLRATMSRPVPVHRMRPEQRRRFLYRLRLGQTGRD